MIQDIVKNKKIQESLAVLEKGYGYPIAILPAPGGYESINAIACQDELARFVVYYRPQKATASLIYHELMHLLLTLEGWPIPTLDNWDESSEDERLFCIYSRSSIEHLVINSRMHEHGMFNDKEYFDWIYGVTLFTSEHDHPYVNITEPFKAALFAITFAELLISPLSHINKINLIQSFSQKMPIASKCGHELAQVYTHWAKILPQGYALFFNEALGVVNLQQMVNKYINYA